MSTKEATDLKVKTIEGLLEDMAQDFGVRENTDEYDIVLSRLAEYVAGQLGISTVAVKQRKAKLTWDKVADIRRRFKAGEQMSPLAEEFGVTYSTVSRIVTNKMWIKNGMGA